MKSSIIKASVILLLLLGVLVLSNRFYGATLNLKPLQPETSSLASAILASAMADQQPSDTPAIGLSAQSSENDSESDFSAPAEQLTVPQTVKQKMRFEDDWCIAAIDLDQHEFAYYQRELKDWDLARGRIRVPHPVFSDRPLDEQGQYLLPYLDASRAELLTHIRADNEFAMLLALSRRDFSLTQQQRIARRLVTKGHTGNALGHLVLLELVNAEMEYKKEGVINADIETTLHKIMAYIAYGIEYGDLSAMHTYLISISTADFPADLSNYFASTTTNNIPRYFDGLKQTIERARSKSHITLSSFSELPKAAKHQYESMLARMHIDYPAQMQSLQLSLATSVGERLTPSDCVNKQVTFFSELEQRARDSRNAASTE